LANHLEAKLITLSGDDDDEYDACTTAEFSHSGYDAVGEFCKWLLKSENMNSTVIAHNQAGYDGRFILQHMLRKAMFPSTYIRQGSRIMYMT
jgi:hypothetical protein